MATSIIRAGGTGVAGVQTTGGDDGALALKVGPLDATVEALNISAAGTGAFVGQVTATGFTGTLDGILGSGTAAAATTTTLASTTITASGIVKTDDTTAATSTTDGSLQTDGGLSVVLDAVIGDDLFMLSDAAVVTFGADKDVTLTHVADTGLLLNAAMVVQFRDSAINIGSPADGDLDINADDEIELNSTLIDINGNLDVSGTGVIAGAVTTAALTASGIIKTDDTTAATSTTDGSLQTDGGLSVVLDAVIGDDIIMLSDAAQIAFGADKDVTLTHVADTGIALNSKDIAGVASINKGQIGGRRNIIINGAMKVAQRGTSVAWAANGYMALDRYSNTNTATAGRFTMKQTADGPPGFANCLELDVTTADTSIAAGEHTVLNHEFEGQDLQQLKKGTGSAEIITISFYVKGNGNATYMCELFDRDNTRLLHNQFAVTSSWNRIELSITADTTGAFDDDNAKSLTLSFWLHAGATYTGGTYTANTWASQTNANRAVGISSLYTSTDNYFRITGLQMEIGSTATEFEHRTYGEELALCQRYYQLWTGGWNGVSEGAGYIQSTALPWNTTMRVNPTIARTGGTDTTRYPATAWGSIYATTTGAVMFITAVSSGGNEGWQATGTAVSEL